jgi:hypothetical protein
LTWGEHPLKNLDPEFTLPEMARTAGRMPCFHNRYGRNKLMSKISTTIYKGKTIYIIDLSKMQSQQVVPTLQEAQASISSLPAKSALILTDATDAVYNQESSNAIKAFSKYNTPYIKASAVVGADGLRAILLQAVAALTNREIKPFKTRAEALEWLAAH